MHMKRIQIMKRIDRQSGVSLITAVFLITGLAVLAALMTRLTVLQSAETISEWYSAQALYAAESGLDWAAQDILSGNTGVTVNTPVTTNSWVSTTINSVASGSRTLYTITSNGKAGGTATSPRVQRQLVVKFMP